MAAGICLLFAIAVPSTGAQEDDAALRPEVFRGNASAQAISVEADRKALIPVPELFRFIALDGQGIYESANRQARASLFFPGNGLILGPSLACGTFASSFPEEMGPILAPILSTCLQYKYPLTVFADDFQPDGATSGSLAFGAANDPISGNAVRAKAHAGEDATTTDAVLQDLRVLGVPPFGPITPQIGDFEMDTSLLKVDSAVSRTNQRIVKGKLVVEAETALSGISLIGGLIRIENLTSRSVVTDDAKGKRTATPTLTMSGVTAFDQPAKITNDGLVVGSSESGPLDQQIQSGINQVVQALGVKVSILDSEQDLAKNGAAVANVGGLLIEFSRSVQGLPTTPRFPHPQFPNTEADPNGVYTGTIQLGATGAVGAAFDFDDEIFDPGTDGDFFFDPGLPGDLGTFDPGEPGIPGVDAPFLDGGSPDQIAGPGGARPESERGRLARSIGAFFGDRLGMLYLALMFAVLGLCVAPAKTVPARFGPSA